MPPSNLNFLIIVIMLGCWAPPSGSNEEKRQTVLMQLSTTGPPPTSCPSTAFAHLTVHVMIHSSHNHWAYKAEIAL
jgi:hypothetical protein